MRSDPKGPEPTPLTARQRLDLCHAISRGGYVSLATRRAVIQLADDAETLEREIEGYRQALEEERARFVRFSNHHAEERHRQHEHNQAIIRELTGGTDG